jgi:hypothetical protein
MARIAEDLLLLLLDNDAAQPCVERAALGRLLAGALLLDLAYDCRVRPAVPSDPVPPGRLVALRGPVPMDPAVRPALSELQRAPMTPRQAVDALRKRAEDDVLDQLLRTGQIHQVQLSSHRLRRNSYAWPLHDRSRIDVVRAAVLAAVLHASQPDPPTAAVIALLSISGALSRVLQIDESAARQAMERAGGITFGAWAETTRTDEVNLAMTAAAVLPALA